MTEMRIVELNEKTRQDLLAKLLRRSPNQYPEQEKTVAQILSDVRLRKDEAVFDYTERFDGIRLTPDTLRVTKEEFAEAYKQIDEAFISVLRKAIANIESYHAMQKKTSWFTTQEGILLGQKLTPIASVGVYVPGGKAALSSSVLMNVIPAKVAGVSDIRIMTPCRKDGTIAPAILVAAKEVGVETVYKVGGAQAIAALAYGTESIPKVDKIVGPGNIYVALAKKAVYGNVGIDSIAGPSEILVLADETANPRYVAADLLSQAEHDALASAILITTSEELAKQVTEEVERFADTLSRRDTILASLENYGYVLVAKSMEDAIAATNEIASEHLEILTENPMETMTHIKNAGAIFLGAYASEPLGDYLAGPNHILPTNGTAKFFSPLSVDDFVKKSSVISYSKDALAACGRDVIRFAQEEGLTAHANSIAVRLDDMQSTK